MLEKRKSQGKMRAASLAWGVIAGGAFALAPEIAQAATGGLGNMISNFINDVLGSGPTLAAAAAYSIGTGAGVYSGYKLWEANHGGERGTTTQNIQGIAGVALGGLLLVAPSMWSGSANSWTAGSTSTGPAFQKPTASFTSP